MALKDDILKVMGGMHVAAVATVADGKPAVRFMALNGFDDLTLVGGTMKTTRKVGEIRKNQDVALSIWSCRDFSDPYVMIQAKGTVHDDLATKKKYWAPMMAGYFKTPENPEWVILKFAPRRIEYYANMAMQVWER